MASTKGEQKGSAYLLSLEIATGPEGMSWNCIKGGSGWVLGKDFSLR